MGTVSFSLPSDGTTADVADYNTPLTTLQTEFNGNIDNNNIKIGAAIATSKLADDAGISTAKVANNAITAAKLSTDAIKLGYSEVTSSTTAAGAIAEVTGLATTVTIPAGGRDVELVLEAGYSSNVASVNHTVTLWDGAVTSGTALRSFFFSSHIADINVVNSRTHTCRIAAPTAGSKTYRVSITPGSSSIRMYADSAVRASLTVKVI